MKRRLLFVTFAICNLQFAMPFAFAAFEDTGTGARGAALGSNYASMGDDVLSLMYNPAALARVQQIEITAEYSRLYTGLSDNSNLGQNFMGYGQPVPWGGTLAFGWKQFSLDSLYTERTLSLGYGEWITPTVAVGGAVKQLHRSFGVPNIVVDNNGNVQSGTPNFFAQFGNTTNAYSTDLGVLYRMTERNTLGISVQDVNQPNVALNPNDQDPVPQTVRMSLAYAGRRNLTLAAGVTTRASLLNQRDYTWTGSAEKWWDLQDGDAFAARGSLAAGSREFQQVSLGAGYRMKHLQIDYAFVFNLGGIAIGSTTGTHRFSLSYRFGPKVVAAKSKAQPKPRAKRAMPELYELPQPETGAVLPPATTPQVPKAAPVRALPRELELQITPEEIDEMPPSLKVQDISMSVVFDADYDGVSDDADKCPDTPFGMTVDAQGCASTQLDHQGNPLPKKVDIEFLPLEEGGN